MAQELCDPEGPRVDCGEEVSNEGTVEVDLNG